MDAEGAVDEIAEDAEHDRCEGNRDELLFEREAEESDPRRRCRRAAGDPDEIKSRRMHLDVSDGGGCNRPIPDGHLASRVFFASSPIPAMVLARLESSSGIRTSFEFGEATIFPIAVT